MTAIIGILNKSAVAIAADSAVSVSNEDNRKVYNHANKIFNLSVGSPIGIMVYNNAEFVGIPWETIIKMYRTHSGNKKFDQVTGYRDDFFTYLNSFTAFFSGVEERRTVEEISVEILIAVEDDLIKASDGEVSQEDLIKLQETEKREHYRTLLISVIENTLNKYKDTPFHTGFDPGDKEALKAKYHEYFDELVVRFASAYLLKDELEIIKSLKELILEISIKQLFIESYTGLVFTGFGETEIFPSLYSITVGGYLNGKIRYFFDPSAVIINSEMSASITPFAQIDIMQTFVEGIDPEVRDFLPVAFNSALHEYKDHILSKIDYSSPAEKELKGVLEQTIPEVVDALVKRLEELRRQSHIDPMLETISTLSKEDLAEMAGSLINLTYLKRRVSFSEESVGGPVDVALITKGDGFVWIKRKHYFDPALNLNYLAKINSQKS